MSLESRLQALSQRIAQEVKFKIGARDEVQIKLWVGTQASYDLLDPAPTNGDGTLYFITDLE